MAMPVALVVILTTRYIAEGMLTPQEVAVYTRSSTISAAAATGVSVGSCTADRTAIAAKSGISQTVDATCARYRAEKGLSREKPFFRALKDGARPWPRIIRDVEIKRPIQDVKGSGTGTFLMDKPDFLVSQGAVTSRQAFLIPEMKFWDHGSKPFKAGHDKVIWQALRQHGTYQLFPKVFPSWNK